LSMSSRRQVRRKRVVQTIPREGYSPTIGNNLKINTSIFIGATPASTGNDYYRVDAENAIIDSILRKFIIVALGGSKSFLVSDDAILGVAPTDAPLGMNASSTSKSVASVVRGLRALHMEVEKLGGALTDSDIVYALSDLHRERYFMENDGGVRFTHVAGAAKIDLVFYPNQVYSSRFIIGRISVGGADLYRAAGKYLPSSVVYGPIF